MDLIESGWLFINASNPALPSRIQIAIITDSIFCGTIYHYYHISVAGLLLCSSSWSPSSFIIYLFFSLLMKFLLLLLLLLLLLRLSLSLLLGKGFCSVPFIRGSIQTKVISEIRFCLKDFFHGCHFPPPSPPPPPPPLIFRPSFIHGIRYRLTICRSVTMFHADVAPASSTFQCRSFTHPDRTRSEGGRKGERIYS